MPGTAASAESSQTTRVNLFEYRAKKLEQQQRLFEVSM
jgi:hypothetical protein